jgi:hypothetical protein
MRVGLARMVAGLRSVVAIAAVVSALVGAQRPLSWWWLVPAVVVVILWTSFYSAVAWRRGLLPWLIGIDVLVAALLCLAVGKLVPAHAVPGALSWVSTIASMTVVSAQLAGRPLLSVPAGLFVAGGLVIGSRLAHSSDGGIPVGLILLAQTVFAAVVMVAAMRGEQSAVRAFGELESERTAAVLDTARREDERARQREVHGGPLTTLAMALHADARHLSPVLRERAAAARQDLLRLAAPPSASGAVVQLDARLAQVVVWYASRLRISTTLAACSVPYDAAEALAKATGEALENVLRHAGTQQARLDLTADEYAVQVTVTDHGRGFRKGQARAAGFGVREEIPGRMAEVGGTASVDSSPGAGTVVRLTWHRDRAAP